MTDKNYCKPFRFVPRKVSQEELVEGAAKYKDLIRMAMTLPPPAPFNKKRATIEEVVGRYRELYKDPNIVKPTDISVVLSPEECAKQMMFTKYIMKSPYHLGRPVGKPPFETEKEVRFILSVNLEERRGEQCRLTIYTCDPWTKELSLVVQDTFKTSEPAVLELSLNEMVNAARIKGTKCLQFIVQGDYVSWEKPADPVPNTVPETEANNNNDAVKKAKSLVGPFFCKRFEVWSYEHGYSFSSKSSVKCWPLNIRDILKAKNYQPVYELILTEPCGWENQPDTVLKAQIDITILEVGGSEPEEPYNFNRDINATVMRETIEEKNDKVASEVTTVFNARLVAMENVMRCSRVVFEPSFGVRYFLGMDCVICKKAFRTVPELLAHIYKSYPYLAVQIQQIGEFSCKIYLSVVDGGGELTINQLGRPDLHFLEEENRNKSDDFLEIMLLGQCSFPVFHTQEFMLRRDKLEYSLFLKRSVMCHLCNMTPNEYATYLRFRPRSEKMARTPISFQEKTFWILLLSFLIKTSTHGIQFLSPYVLMRMFVHCHELLFVENFAKIRETFHRFLDEKWNEVFDSPPLHPTLILDLITRAINQNNVDYYSHQYDFLYTAIWNDTHFKERTEPEFNALKSLTSKPKPTTPSGRVFAINLLMTNQIVARHFKIPHIFYGISNRFGNPVFIPKCLYYGATITRAESNSIQTYYNK